MDMLKIDERLDFIDSLELDQSLKALSPANYMSEPSNNDPAAYVDAGSLTSFVAGVSAQHKSDALNSTLLAQLAANKKFNREVSPVDWYTFYKTVLENVGWVVQNWEFTKYNASGTSFTVDAVIAELLAAIATSDDKAIIDEAINAVKALDNGDGRLVLWEQNSSHLSKGNFQISACSESDGVLVMKIGAFYFSTDETVTNVLWFTFSSTQTELYKGGQTINLNEDVYSKVRQTVIDKLGVKAQDFVGDLDI